MDYKTKVALNRHHHLSTQNVKTLFSKFSTLMVYARIVSNRSNV
jgi:hypothetical protein